MVLGVIVSIPGDLATLNWELLAMLNNCMQNWKMTLTVFWAAMSEWLPHVSPLRYIITLQPRHRDMLAAVNLPCGWDLGTRLFILIFDLNYNRYNASNHAQQRPEIQHCHMPIVMWFVSCTCSIVAMEVNSVQSVTNTGQICTICIAVSLLQVKFLSFK